MARKAKDKPLGESQREPNVEKEMQEWLHPLFEAYYETDPGLGKATELGKTERAHLVVECWWYVFRYLMLWAQSHFAGHAWANSNPEAMAIIARKFGITDLHPDSHIYEYIGLTCVYNQANPDDPTLDRLSDLMLKHAQDDFAIEQMRMLIVNLLASRSTESSFWRMPLSNSLFALNYGDTERLLLPSGRRQGDGLKLIQTKLIAVQHVYYMVGKGFKKHVAQNKVADAVGQSIETLKAWEKSFKREAHFVARMQSAKTAGQFEELLRNSSMKEASEVLSFRYRNLSEAVWARSALNTLDEMPLESLRQALRDRRIRHSTAKEGTNTAEIPTQKKGRKPTQNRPRITS
jgi:hypothetical protein